MVSVAWMVACRMGAFLALCWLGEFLALCWLGDTAKAAFVGCEGGLRSPGRARLSHLGSLSLILSVNVRHSPGVKINLGPSGFLESRRAWPP